MRRLPLRKSALILFDKGANDLAIMGDKDLTPLSEVQKDSKQVCVIYHSILVGRVFEKSLRLRGLGRFYKGIGTVPLPAPRYGCGSRTLIFEHPQ